MATLYQLIQATYTSFGRGVVNLSAPTNNGSAVRYYENYLKDRFNYEYLICGFATPHILLIAELGENQPHPLVISC